MVPHGLGNAGRVAFGYAQSHLRGDIPGCKAGAAGGEDQVHLTGIRKAQQLGFELGGIVRQKQRFFHLVACGGEHLHNERAAFVLPFAAAALIGKGDHRRAQGQICRGGQQLHLVAGVDGAAFYHPCEHALPRHDAVAGLPADGAVAVALLADLGHFQHGIPNGKKAGHRQGGKIEPFHHQIFAKGTVVHPELLTENFNFFRAQQADLPVPAAAVGIAHNTPLRGENSGRHRRFQGAAPGACADSQNFTHKFVLSSDPVHPSCGGHRALAEVMFPGFCQNRVLNGLQKGRVVRAAAQQSTQVGAGFAGKARTQKALTCQPHPVAGSAEFAVHGSNQPDAAAPAGRRIIHRRPIAKGRTGHRLQPRPAAVKALQQFRAGKAGQPGTGMGTVFQIRLASSR